MTRKRRDADSCSCGCGCEQLATTTDDMGMPVCEACSESIVVEGGDVVCRRLWDQCLGGKYEHNIVEHGIETHGPGKPNTQYRFCARCGAEWHLEERGRDNWVVVQFAIGKDEPEPEVEVEDEDEDEFGACQGGPGQGGSDD